jgi:hypothetical protein
MHDRLDEHDISTEFTTYRPGATTDSLIAAHGLSLKNVKRILRIVGTRRASPGR